MQGFKDKYINLFTVYGFIIEKKKGKEKVAINAIKKGILIEDIIVLTGLSKQQI